MHTFKFVHNVGPRHESTLILRLAIIIGNYTCHTYYQQSFYWQYRVAIHIYGTSGISFTEVTLSAIVHNMKELNSTVQVPKKVSCTTTQMCYFQLFNSIRNCEKLNEVCLLVIYIMRNRPLWCFVQVGGAPNIFPTLTTSFIYWCLHMLDFVAIIPVNTMIILDIEIARV